MCYRSSVGKEDLEIEREVLLPCRNVYSASDPRFVHLIELPDQSVQGRPLVVEASRLGNQINS